MEAIRGIQDQYAEYRKQLLEAAKKSRKAKKHLMKELEMSHEREKEALQPLYSMLERNEARCYNQVAIDV